MEATPINHPWIVRHTPTAHVLYEDKTAYACRSWLQEMIALKQLQRPRDEYKVEFLGDRDDGPLLPTTRKCP